MPKNTRIKLMPKVPERKLSPGELANKAPNIPIGYSLGTLDSPTYEESKTPGSGAVRVRKIK